MFRGLKSNKEWVIFEPFVIDTAPKSGPPPGDHRMALYCIV